MKYVHRGILFGLLILAGCGDSGTNVTKEEKVLIFEGNTLIPNGPDVPLFNNEQKQKGKDLPKISEEQKNAMREALLNYSRKKNTPYVAFISSKKKKKYKYNYFKLKPDKEDIEKANGETLFYYILFVNPQTYEAYRIIAAKIPKTENQKEAIQDWARKFGFKSENANGGKREKSGTFHCYWKDVYEWHEEYGYHGYTIWVCEEQQLDPGGGGGGSSGCHYEPGGCEEESDPTDPPGGGGSGDDDDDNENNSCPTGQVEDENGNCVDLTNCETSSSDIGAAFPNASTDAKDKLEDVINQYSEEYGIDNKYELQHFLAQAAHESGGFTDLSISENLNYSVQGLLNTFPHIFSQNDPNKADPDDYAGKPEDIANLVYSETHNPYLGNGSYESGDGWKYRGRGIFQLTGKYNYQQFTNFAQNDLNLTNDFVQHPGLLSSNNEMAILSAMWFFSERVLSSITINENTSVEKVTKIVNGGQNNLDDRKDKFNDAQTHINDCIK